MKRRSQLGRVLRRDNRLCGMHLGGCGATIEGRRDGTVDHIIPSAFFSKVAGGGRHLYERDWNCQPMHVACNQSKADWLSSWPRFQCDCHYLQVEDGNLFVLTRGRTDTTRHILLRDVVSVTADRVDARMVIGPGKLGGQKVHGAAVGMKARFGYVLPGIAARRVDWFNLHERVRVGLPVPKTFRLTEEGHIIPVGTETVKREGAAGNHDHFPALPVPDGGFAVFGSRR